MDPVIEACRIRDGHADAAVAAGLPCAVGQFVGDIAARAELDMPPGIVHIETASLKEHGIVDVRRIVVVRRPLRPGRGKPDIALL